MKLGDGVALCVKFRHKGDPEGIRIAVGDAEEVRAIVDEVGIVIEGVLLCEWTPDMVEDIKALKPEYAAYYIYDLFNDHPLHTELN